MYYDYLCCEYLAKAGGAFVTNNNTSGTAHPFLVPPSPPSSAPKNDAWSIDEDPVSVDIYIRSKTCPLPNHPRRALVHHILWSMARSRGFRWSQGILESTPVVPHQTPAHLQPKISIVTDIQGPQSPWPRCIPDHPQPPPSSRDGPRGHGAVIQISWSPKAVGETVQIRPRATGRTTGKAPV